MGMETLYLLKTKFGSSRISRKVSEYLCGGKNIWLEKYRFALKTNGLKPRLLRTADRSPAWFTIYSFSRDKALLQLWSKQETPDQLLKMELIKTGAYWHKRTHGFCGVSWR